MVKVIDPRNIQGAYDDPRAAAQELAKGEDSALSPAGVALNDQAEAYLRDQAAKDLGEKESSPKNTWTDNTSAQKNTGIGGAKDFWNKSKVFMKKRGAIAGIIALLGGGAAFPFLGVAGLPFAILGNFDAKSAMHGASAYLEDYLGFRIFGSKTASVDGSGSKIAGLREAEIAQLKEKGVEFRGGKTNSITKRTTFTAVRMKGGAWIEAGTAFNDAMLNDVNFRNAMIYTKSSYWKAFKSQAAVDTRVRYGGNPNPDLSSDNPDSEEAEAERNRKLMQSAVGDTSSDVSTRVTSDEDSAKTDVEKANSETQQIADGLKDEIEAKKAAIADGKIPTSVAADSNLGNIATALDKEGVDLTGAIKGGAGSMWGYVNSLDALDTVCTVYQTANTAAILARGVALASAVRLFYAFRASLERTKAGEDSDNTVHYLMNILNKPDPTTGQKFDGSTFASALFTGQLSDEPSTVSMYGGQAMIALLSGLHALHSAVGLTNASAGRTVLKNACGAVTNLGVQIAATVGSFAATFFTGGGAAVGVGALNAGIKQGISQATKQLAKSIVEKFGKKAIKEAIEKATTSISEKGFSRVAWSGFKKLYNNMSVWDKVGVLVAGVSTFGMAYIVDTLSGADVAGAIGNGVSFIEKTGLGYTQVDLANGIASGGSIATYASASAYQSTKNTYEQNYIADMKYDARSTPLDITNPYSTLGAAVFGAQKMVGLSSSSNIIDWLKSVAMLPLKIPSLGTAKADDTALTPQAIGEKIGDPYMIENQIAQNVTGVPQVVFQKSTSFDSILTQFVDNSSPQISYSGNDEDEGGPKLSIIPGSDLANYKEQCRNPNRTEVDPQFANEDGSNFYDIKLCTENRNAAYDDAIGYVSQVSPPADQGSGINDPTVPSITGLPEGGLKDTEADRKQGWALAEQFIKDLNKIRKGGKGYPFKDITDYSLGYGRSAGTPGSSASGGPCFYGASNCDQCYALTAWFLDKFTTQKIGTTTSSGDGVVAYLKKQGIPTGNEAKVYSVFSYGRAVDGSGAHTGIVIGIDGDYAITLENNFAFNGELYLNKRPKNGADFRGNGSRTEFAYINDAIKDTPKEY